MHESAIAGAVLDAALAEAARLGARSVSAVRVTLGDRSGLSGETLRAAFTERARGTIAQGAALEVREGAGRTWTLESVRVVT